MGVLQALFTTIAVLVVLLAILQYSRIKHILHRRDLDAGDGDIDGGDA